MAPAALPKSVVDGAIVHRVMRPTRMRMVGQDVHVLPQHLLRLKTDHPGPCRVDEDAQTFQVYAKNPFAGRSEHETQWVTPGVDHGQARGLKLVEVCTHAEAQANAMPNSLLPPIGGAPPKHFECWQARLTSPAKSPLS